MKKKALKLKNNFADTIVAPATALGRAGVGVVRVSGPNVSDVCRQVIGKLPQPRYAKFANFIGANETIIDQGLALYFPEPHSFTGEDVLELHTHGSPVVIDRLVGRIVQLGARLARPGEFSERAFLNGKMDLTQAEAVADLIAASSEQAANSALNSLRGEFSRKIEQLKEKIINLRTYIEAEIDFSEEELEFIAAKKIQLQLAELMSDIENIQKTAQQGQLLRDGIRVVIAGKPNVGKSSLLNLFCGQDSAIVSDIPGTTRDVLKEYINFAGLPFHIIDTAGLHESSDFVEREGIKRAWQEIELADFVLLLTDEDDVALEAYRGYLHKVIVVRNKIDLAGVEPHQGKIENADAVFISVKTGAGVELLKQYLKQRVGYHVVEEGAFSARRRHLLALEKTQSFLRSAVDYVGDKQLELLAEELRLAQISLGEIIGEFYTEDLLDRIFSEFCVGK